MKWIVVLAMLGGSMAVSGQAEARGCVRGAIVGGIAGHFAGHGMMGAAAGCAVGHHYMTKRNAPPQQNGTPDQPPPAQ